MSAGFWFKVQGLRYGLGFIGLQGLRGLGAGI